MFLTGQCIRQGAAKAAAKQAKKLRQKAKRTPIITQQATHPVESAQLGSNVTSEVNAAAPTAAPTTAPTAAPTAALTTAPASEQASAKAKQGTAALPKWPQPSMQNAADATVTVLLVEPVNAGDGHTYEKSAMEHWLGQHDTSPVTGAKLMHARLVPNRALRSIIANSAR
ncbi:TPA: hypothetical protein ACH3X1_009728 [Trebouxia sp. C0004]